MSLWRLKATRRVGLNLEEQGHPRYGAPRTLMVYLDEIGSCQAKMERRIAYAPEKPEVVPSPSSAGTFTLMPPNIILSKSHRNNICSKTLALL